MEKILSLTLVLLFINCSSMKVSKSSPIDEKQLTGGNIKYWNINPSKNGAIKENCWIFRQDGTFSYYDYLKYKQNGNVEVMKWLSDDIKVGENGSIPWSLKSHILEISRIKYRVLKLQHDSLIVESPYSTYSPIDTLLFTYCKKCSKYSRFVDFKIGF